MLEMQGTQRECVSRKALGRMMTTHALDGHDLMVIKEQISEAPSGRAPQNSGKHLLTAIGSCQGGSNEG